MKQIMKTFLALAIMAVGMITGSSVVLAENYVPVNAANFPDTAIRNALERVVKESVSSDDELGENTEYIEYDFGSSGTFRRDSSGVLSVDTDSVEYLSVYGTDGTVYSADCIKKFSGLGYFTAEKYGASSFTSDQNLFYVSLGGVSTSSLKVSASHAQVVDISGLKSLKSVTVNAPKALSVMVNGQKITKISFGNMSGLETLSLGGQFKSFDVSKYTKLKGFYISAPVTKLTGMKKLKQLESVSISKTGLKALDFSTNKKLKYVSCISNKRLTSLKLPSAVVSLYATDNNIKSLNLKNLKKLIYLSVNGNKNLKTLDVSKNKNLTSLNAGCTKVSKLNLANNKKLTSLSCYQTKLNSLNLKKNTKLKYLSFYGSKIKKLNLSKQKKLTLSFETKKGKTISLKNYIGSGYKAVNQSDALSYSKKTGKIKVKKRGYSKLTLKKGSRVFYVEIYAK